jgi:hypothetical protein
LDSVAALPLAVAPAGVAAEVLGVPVAPGRVVSAG